MLDYLANLQATKRIFGYIKGTQNDEIFYENIDDVKLLGYTNNDQAGDIKTRKSTLG